MKRLLVITLITILCLTNTAYAAEYVSGNMAAVMMDLIFNIIRGVVIALVVVICIINVIGIISNPNESESKMKIIKNSIVSGIIIVSLSIIVEWVSKYMR